MRRGQVTLFIILGLVIVLTMIVGMAIYKDWLTFRPPEEYVIQEPTTELKPLAFAVERCQVQLLDEAVRKALLTGGYIDPSSFGVFSTNPPAGTGAAVPGSVVSYWSHVQAGAFNTHQPSLVGPESSSISSQLADYVDERLDACVSWDEFSQYGIEKGEPRSLVTFSTDKTRITTYWDVAVTTALGVTELNGFAAEIDAPVQHLYDLADDIMRGFRHTRQPERLTMEWLSVYAIGSGNALPPLYWGTQSDRGMRFWALEPAREDLSEMIGMMTEHLELVESRDWRIALTDDQRVNDLYEHGMILSFIESDTVGFRAMHPSDSGVHLAVNDNVGIAMPEILPQPGWMNWLSPPLVDYTFFFDITYPLVVRLEENGYVMQAAYEVNVWKNNPLDATELSEASETGFCENPGGTLLRLSTQPSTDGQVLYTCGQVACAVGATVDGRLEATLPACANGIIEMTHEELFSERVPVASAYGNTLDLRLHLFEARETELELRQRFVREISDGEFGLTSNAFPAEAEVLLIRQGEPFVANTQGGPVTLVPGRYDVYVIGVKEFDPPLTIPEKTDCFDPEPLNPFNDDECYTLNATNFSSLPTTYLELSGENGVEIARVPERLVVTAAGLDPNDVQDWDDVGLIGAVFDEAGELTADAVTLEN